MQIVEELCQSPFNSFDGKDHGERLHGLLAGCQDLFWKQKGWLLPEPALDYASFPLHYGQRQTIII